MSTIHISEVDLSEAAQRWMFSSGTKSRLEQYLFTRLILMSREGSACYPRNSEDWERVQRMMELVPEIRKRTHLLAESSPIWKGQLERWAELCRLSKKGATGRMNEIILQICLENGDRIAMIHAVNGW